MKIVYSRALLFSKMLLLVLGIARVAHAERRHVTAPFGWDHAFNFTPPGFSNCSGFTKHLSVTIRNLSPANQDVRIISTTKATFDVSNPSEVSDRIHINNSASWLPSMTTFPTDVYSSRTLDTGWKTLTPLGTSNDTVSDRIYVLYFGPAGATAGLGRSGFAKGSTSYEIQVRQDRGAVAANLHISSNTPTLSTCTGGGTVADDSNIPAIMPPHTQPLNGGRAF